MASLSNNGISGKGLPNAGTNGGADPLEGIPFRKRVRQATREIESQIILEALEKHRWNRRRTAEELRISYRLLMYKMKNCNLREASPVGRSVSA
jgi:DNA-binding NtrC family response regulator